MMQKGFKDHLLGSFDGGLSGCRQGVGLTTAKACLRLWVGFPPDRAAVKSCGNGPAMRSAIIGAYFADDARNRREFVSASSSLTHRGWQAEVAALAVAECAAFTIQHQGQPHISRVITMLRGLSAEAEWHSILSRIESGLSTRVSVAEFVCSMGLEHGVSGYAMHAVPVAIYSWLRHQNDFCTALVSALSCGGDTDTVGAIVGALAGATGGKNCIPSEWLNAIREWPCSSSVITRIAGRLAEQKSAETTMGPVQYFWPGRILRNLVFLLIVLAHGFRRLIPPY